MGKYIQAMHDNAQREGRLLSDKSKDGVRTESYRMPDGRVIAFVSAVARNGAGSTLPAT